MYTTSTILAFLGTSIIYYVFRQYAEYLRYERARKSLGCPPLSQYPSWDPIFGIGYVKAMLKALKEDRFLQFQSETYAARGAKVWTANFLGNRMVYSSEPQNMKAMSTSHKDAFAVEPIRIANGAITPFTGPGVSSSDGAKWQASRDLVKPYFERGGFSNLDRLSGHMDRLIDKIPRDSSAVDMQPLFQRWFLDTSTDFLFGDSINSLEHPERDWPQRYMMKVQAGLRVRLQLSSFLFLHRDKKWFAACKRIHEFLDGYINKAYQDLEDEKNSGKAAVYASGKPRDDFLWTIVKRISDKLECRNELTAVWIPSNETTSIFMSNTIYALARYPEIVAKIRKEVLDYGDKPLTFEGLRSMEYLRWTINESHRLYPVSLQTVRACVKDTALPTGGGKDGKSPIFCAKGDIVHCNRYLMHRDPDLWGPDAEEFRPERWKTARPMWKFVPFGGGPRICPAHVMVDTECSYAIFRILREFKTIEARDDRPYTATMRVGPSSKYGCKVAFIS
ncbi:Cytochrome P450 monooxygenase lepH [Lachnellula suecica]|uniref:Cytochrome P450 monooxygenase lepH n=1 Tax=Lachnellula suecica TaxID=602035 RepID=A0A8T9CJH8_9HELO|nr:Cytochrome P450 monooxygenase lepH [Lachnellula suecica]